MTPKQFQRAKRLFKAAFELPAEDRAAFLAGECPEDPEVRAAVEKLLAEPTGEERGRQQRAIRKAELAKAAEETTRLAETGTETPPDRPTPRAAAMPDSIGQYRILGELGQGGMGVVYEAEQKNPRRRVAIKIVRGGQFVDDLRVRMFQREIDTLARLKHPSIGAIHESGRTDDGQHFFAMELVRGETLDVYLKKRSPALTREESRFRLALLRKIADAVHYAHQRGVIHRDLKPSNIVVTAKEAPKDDAYSSGSPAWGEPLPEIKILDFGLARITDRDVATTTLVTEVGVIKGTLPYMSPEQARGKPEEVDVRSDVYALGVILYEMLTGRRPYDVLNKSLAEAVRVICEEPPQPLYQAMRDGRRLDADVETIVGKALEKDAERRYPSAAELSGDVTRFLTSQPITARRPSAIYQLRKFAERNRVLVAGVVATFVVLLAGIVVSTVLGLKEAAQRRETEQAKTDLEAVVEFQSGMLSEVDPEQMGRWMIEDLRERVGNARRGRNTSEAEVEKGQTAFDAVMRGVNVTDAALEVIDRNILGRAAETLEERVADQPLIAARLRHTIGETYAGFGLWEKAERHLLEAVEIRQNLLGPDNELTLTSKWELAWLYRDMSRYREAEPLLVEVVEGRRRVLGPNHLDTIDSTVKLSVLYWHLGRYKDSVPLFLESIEKQRSVLGEEHPRVLLATIGLSQLYRHWGRHNEAETLLLRVVELRRRTADDSDSLVRDANFNLGELYLGLGRYAEAEQRHLATIRASSRVAGQDYPWTLSARAALADVYAAWGREAEAESIYLETLESQRRLIGDEHDKTMSCRLSLGRLYVKQRRFDEAESILEEGLEIRRKTVGKEHPATLALMSDLIDFYRSTDRPTEARQLLEQLLTLRAKLARDPHGDPSHKEAYASLRLRSEPDGPWDPEEGLRFALEACELTDYSNWQFLDTLALAYHLTGQPAKAAETQQRAMDLMTASGFPVPETYTARLTEYEASSRRTHD